MCKYSEYIKKPYWVDLKHLLEVSKNFRMFSEKMNIDLCDEYFDLNSLRNYYRIDKHRALDLIDELAIRGFTFRSNKSSTILPSMVPSEPIMCILSTSENDSFRRINFASLGLGNFVERFSVASDGFFDGILIQYFSHLNKSINIRLVETVFTENGFIIKPAESIKSSNAVNDECEKAKSDELIIKVFSDGIFNNFRDYCNSNGLVYISDLKGFNFEALGSLRGFGATRIRKIIERYKAFTEKTSNLFEQQDIWRDKSINQHIGEVLIDIAFSDNYYRIFRNFCADRGFTKVSDLWGFDFDSLIDVDGLEIGKIRAIKERYQEIIQAEDSIDSGDFNEQQNDGHQFNIHNDFIDVDIELAFDDNVLAYMKEKGIERIGDLIKIKNGELRYIQGIGQKRLNDLTAEIKLFENNLDTYIQTTFAELSKHEGYDIYRRRVLEKKTLEQIGKEQNVTREWIRQKEVKTTMRIGRMLSIVEASLNNRNYFDGKSVLKFEDLVSMFGSYENALLIKDYIADKGLRHISYFEDMDIFLVNMKVDVVQTKLDEILESIGDVFNFYDKMLEIEELLLEKGIQFIDIFAFEEYLNRKKYKKYNDYYSKNRLTGEYLSSLIVEKFFPNGLTYNPESMQKVKDLMVSEYGLKEYAEKNDRNVWVALGRENANCILWGSNTRVHINNVKIEDELLREIKTMIDTNLENSTSISVDFVYNQFRSKLDIESNVKDKFALYGVLKYYFKDDYAFKKYLIKKQDAEKLTIQQMLEEFIIASGGRVTVKETNEKFKWTQVMLNTTINFNKNILSWNDGKELIHASILNLSDDFISKLYEKISDSFVDGYTNAYMILKKAAVLLMKNGINDEVSVFSLAKYLYSDRLFFSRRPHILLEPTKEQFTSNQLILRMFEKKSIISYEELKSTLMDIYRFSELMAGNIIMKSRSDMFQLHMDQYCLLKDVIITHEDINLVKTETELLFKNKNYITLTEFEAFNLNQRYIQVKDLKIEWNRFVVKAIIEHFFKKDYRIIMRKGADYKFDKIIIVKYDSEISTLEELMVQILENEFTDKGNMTLRRVESFFVQKDIIYQKIPEEFFKLSCINIDEFGRINILKEWAK